MNQRLQQVWNSFRQLNVTSALLGLIVLMGLFGAIFWVQDASQVQVEQGLQEVAFTNNNGVQFSIIAEVAETPFELYQGLRFRQSMPQNRGMLFIFPSEQLVTFTMADTFIPLDMVMFDERLQVVKIHQNTATNQDEIFYPSELPVKYVLETNAGWVERSGITVGNFLSIR